MTGASDLTSKIIGIGNPGGGLQKLRITCLDSKAVGRVEALFNPAEISRSRSIGWEQAESLQFGRAPIFHSAKQFIGREPETLSIELFFDTYESHASTSSAGAAAAAWLNTANPFAQGSSSDVTALTRQVVRLGEIDTELHRPPVCRLSWGAYAHIFTGVLTQLDQQFTMFLPNGTPVRATLSCTFTEFITRAAARAGELHSADIDKTRVVRRGDTLQSLAAQEYNDPTQWRRIARANGIINPRLLQPGTTLNIPKLDG